MVSMIENEQELENVVGGIKAKDVAKIVSGAMAIAVLVVGGKFVYDVYDEYETKTNSSNDVAGFLNACGSYIKDGCDAAGLKSKSTYRRLVTETANAIIEFNDNN